MPFAYIASPYSHPDVSVRESRYTSVCRFVHWVATQVPMTPYSPIVHWHPIATQPETSLPTDARFFQKINEDMLFHATNLYVLAIDGWNDSIGVAMEMDYAARCHVPISLARHVPDAISESRLYHISPLHYKGA